MCQIVVIKNNKKLDREFLRQQYNFNRDGVGFVIIKIENGTGKNL